jgi:hypothetical protein
LPQDGIFLQLLSFKRLLHSFNATAQRNKAK